MHSSKMIIDPIKDKVYWKNGSKISLCIMSMPRTEWDSIRLSFSVKRWQASFPSRRDLVFRHFKLSNVQSTYNIVKKDHSQKLNGNICKLH